MSYNVQGSNVQSGQAARSLRMIKPQIVTSRGGEDELTFFDNSSGVPDDGKRESLLREINKLKQLITLKL